MYTVVRKLEARTIREIFLLQESANSYRDQLDIAQSHALIFLLNTIVFASGDS